MHSWYIQHKLYYIGTITASLIILKAFIILYYNYSPLDIILYY